MNNSTLDLTPAIGTMPYRMAFAGGWIDQPLLSRLNPEPTGSMVVVQIEPDVRFMNRCGMATGTRDIALELWGNVTPDRPREVLVRELYAQENKGKADPSGSQDMIGLLYPGVSRLDYSIEYEGGYFPKHIETCVDRDVAQWLESVVWIVPIAQRPVGYNPLGIQRLDAVGVAALGRTGRNCYDAIIQRDLVGLGASMNECMALWERMLPHVVNHPLLETDLAALLRCYQFVYPGAMYSGCGGGYMYVVSEATVPGALKIRIRR